MCFFDGMYWIHCASARLGSAPGHPRIHLIGHSYGARMAAYALAGLTHASHGSTNAVFLPYVMDSLRTVRRADMAKIGHMAGAGTGMREEQAARHAVVHTRELVESVGIPTTLKSFGVTERDLDTLVSDGLGVGRLTKAFPIQPPESTYRVIVRNAFDGVISS